LKRLINQHEGGELPPKKRKADPNLIIPTKCDSSDEGLGSVSPEPMKVVVTSISQTQNESTIADLKQQLAQERNLRLILEEQKRQLESQLYQQQHEIYQEDGGELVLPLVEADSLPPVGHTQIVICSPAVSRSPSPQPVDVPVTPAETRLPSVLEAAIKAEPKVEVERMPSPNLEENQRIYTTSRSRQNLETIVEAIRHLEGDHMFGEDPLAGGGQEVPLALTTRGANENIVKIEVGSYEIQNINVIRPGVIVGKQTLNASMASSSS